MEMGAVVDGGDQLAVMVAVAVLVVEDLAVLLGDDVVVVVIGVAEGEELRLERPSSFTFLKISASRPMWSPTEKSSIASAFFLVTLTSKTKVSSPAPPMSTS